MNKKKINAAAALPTILLISGIIAESILAVVIVATYFSRSGFSARLSAEAGAIAYAGAEDAVNRFIRGDVLPASYSIDFGNSRSATIQSIQDPACESAAAFCGYTIVSTGSAFLSNRKVEAVIKVDPLTREVTVISSKETETTSP
jgi:hypothetical protein